MARVCFHTNGPRDSAQIIELDRVPASGEFVALTASDHDWYQVTGVVHLAFQERTFDAEAWGEPGALRQPGMSTSKAASRVATVLS